MKLTFTLKKQARTILEVEADVSLRSGIVGITGPSGAGKTTLLRCIAGLENYQGQIQFEAPIQRVGMVFQQAGLFSHLSVQKNLDFATHNRLHSRFDLADLAQRFGIKDLLSRGAAQLSGGEQQRVAIVRALVNEPDLLLLDEPLSALHDSARNQLLVELRHFSEQYQLPMLMVSHQLADLALVCEDLLYVNQSKIAQQGSVESLLPVLNQQHSRAVSVLLGEWQPCAEAGIACLKIGKQQVYCRSAGESTLARVLIYADQVSLCLSKPVDSSVVNCLYGQLVGIQHIERGICRCELDVDGQTLQVDISEWSRDRLSLFPGQSVWAQFKLL